MVKRMKKIYSIMLMITVITLALVASTSMMRKASAQLTVPTYFMDPANIEVGPAPSVNQTFTVTLQLNSTTSTNAPNGIAGIEVHMNWNSSFVSPLSFTDLVGSTNGVFNGTDPSELLSTAKGFYLENQTKLSSPPYTDAYEFQEVYASTTGTPWFGNGTIAALTFNVTQQPTSFASSIINYNFTDLVDTTETSVTHAISNATVFFTSLQANSESVTVPWVTSENYTVGISTDSNLTAPTNLDFTNTSSAAPATIDFNATTYGDYVGTCNVTLPNTFMWNASGTDNWVVNVDGTPTTYVATHDTANEYIWVNFTSGTHMITLGAQNYVPEFTTTSLMFALMATMLVATAAAATLRKRKLRL